MREMSSATRCCICEVALVSGPREGATKRGDTGWLPVLALILSADVVSIPIDKRRDGYETCQYSKYHKFLLALF
jgi:hypothetical protein